MSGAAIPGPLAIDGRWFRDQHGRARWLRGINFGGDTKVPTIGGHTYLPTDFADHRTVSFVGRPAPLDEVDAHFARMRHWGFNCLRLLTTWEAVEHGGPGIHDQEYLDYFAQVCRRAGEHGFHVFVDFHQDVWSRMSGGDGAPGWTFEAVGLDFTKFHAAGAAHVMPYNYDHRQGGRQASYPVMSWGGNYRMPANGVMWTLFFAGEKLVSGATIGDENAQRYLQRHYLGSMAALAERVADCANVIGFDTLNEPGSGWIGMGMGECAEGLSGPAFTPLDGLAALGGVPRRLPVFKMGEGRVGERLVNPDRVSAWLSGREDPFRAAGLWDIDPEGQPFAPDPDVFRVHQGEPVHAERDFMVPFFHDVAATIRNIRPDWLVFAEVDPFASLRGGHGFPEGMPERTVNASHWYDLGALITKRFAPDRTYDTIQRSPIEGAEAIRAFYARQLERLRDWGDNLNGGAPSLVGECGIAYDMNEAAAYRAWADGDRTQEPWQAQVAALSLMYDALDDLGLHSTQWNYTVTNRNDPMIGDGWNQEDLSIWSADQATDPGDPDSGGRAVAGFCRPHAHAVQGTPLSQRFDMVNGLYELRFEADTGIAAPTELYLPAIHYPDGYEVSADNLELTHEDGQWLTFVAPCSGPAIVTFRRKPAR